MTRIPNRYQAWAADHIALTTPHPVRDLICALYWRYWPNAYNR